MMRAGRIAILVLGFVLFGGGGGAHAGADSTPVIAIPGRPGVPIMINGRDATGAVVEGDWGLAREQIGVTVIRPPPIRRFSSDPVCRNGWCGSPVARYFPGTGRPPPVGRLEILPPPNRALPPPAETYRRSWAIESARLPPSIERPYQYDIPPVIIGPLRDGGRHGPRR